MSHENWRGRKVAMAMAAIFAASFFHAIAASSEYTVRWQQSLTDTNRWVVEVAGVSDAALRELRQTNWTQTQWSELLSVRTEQENLFNEIGTPPMLGRYGVEKETIRFAPQFPLDRGVTYRASFHPEKLPGARETARVITAVHELRRHAAVPTTVVRQIYPTATVLPENLLKFYIHFSAPMSRGHIYDHIHLRDSAGKDVQLPFLEIDEELWDPSMTRLTLFIDPGRIKRGVQPLEEIGPALQQGKRYTLEIDRSWTDATGLLLKENFRKTFDVGPLDREPMVTAEWKIQTPKAETRQTLTLSFPKPLDHALTQRMIQVVDRDGAFVKGSIALENEERRWLFTPQHPWRPGPQALLVQKTIEDLCGNNIGKAFEVDLFESVQRRFTNETIRLPFEIR